MSDALEDTMLGWTSSSCLSFSASRSGASFWEQCMLDGRYTRSLTLKNGLDVQL
jgi:hypothetical protein